MYLKSIEVHGFKSFANKITFKFHNGITGIVGPNGSGKSNVADAVRWVLGEQRVKQLRGASMQDVIFSGTETRKPMGYAYVAITLDNSDHALAIDFEEVTVSRRVYRSGESEYLINGAICRLKDVYELFYDTGVGKEGYSIIGQGQIDKILSGKPEERRELFDEAAGIVKYKRRKDTAVKKLEEEKTNLIRVNDILSELEKQVEPLEKQSETAKEYLKKKEELKILDVNMFLLEAEKNKSQLISVDEKLKIAGNDLQQTKEQYEHIREEYDQLEAQIEELDKTIEQKRELLSDTSVLKGKLEGEINVLKEQIHSAESGDDIKRERVKTIHEDIEAKEKEKTRTDENKAALDEELGELLKVRDEAKGSLNIVQNKILDLTSGIENGKNEIIDILNERASIKTKLGRYDTMLEQINIRKAELQSRLLRAKSDEVEQEAIIKDLYEELGKISQEIMKLDEQSEVYDEQLGQMKQELIDRDKELGDAQIVYHKEKSKLDALKNMSERYDGYGNSIRRVMEQKESKKGIVGVVADIIKVDKKYETAIETALGGNIQNIVTDDESVAKEMIEFLKSNKLGRATFLPLTSVKDRGEFQKPEALKEKGVIGIAATLVKTDSKYQEVVSQLLGAIIVVDHIDHAIALSKKYHYQLRIVTIEGEYLTPGGAIAGGAFKNNSNLLGRKREIEELEKTVKNCLEKIESIMTGIENTKEARNVLREKLEKLKEEQQEKYIAQNTAQMNVNQALEKKEETAKGFSALEQEDHEIETQVADIRESKNSIQEELKNSEIREKELEEKIQEYGRQLETERNDENIKVLQASELDLEVAGLSQKQEFAQQNAERISGEIEHLKQEILDIEEALSHTAEDIQRRQESILEIQKTIEASISSADDNEIAMKKAIDDKDELSTKKKNFFHTREELSEKMTALDKEVYRLTSQKERLEESAEAQINYMWDEYEITVSAALEMRQEELRELSVIKREILSLKDQIRKLGDVNVNAIEDYKNLMERYGFLKTQHDDLVEAQATLEGIIEELDTAMRKQFEEKFAQIGREFDKVFKELFGGGKGTLELVDDEDILEAGIKIIAQPPGKKLQNMMQLSGGEKSLTAIALLFAIQNLKPSPFCLLDEIEAALDETNVTRFAGYLHKLTKHTQFIVITHRRGTMEKADRLYGITMQEKGVSALVSVNLIDKDLDD